MMQLIPSPAAAGWSGVRLYTVGHSTRTLEELVALLRTFGVTLVCDIRTVPRSRHNPQFNADVLRAALLAAGIRYLHLPSLGGLRHPRRDSINTGWHNDSFRGYADHMQTEGFERGVAELADAVAGHGTAALMCAEAVPWRCHRSLVADALTARGARVEHIGGTGRASAHHTTAFAHVEGTRITYPAPSAGIAAVQLVTQAPFHLEATVRMLQRRATNPVHRWEEDGGCYRVVLPVPSGSNGGANSGLALVEVHETGSVDAPGPELSVMAVEPASSVDPSAAAAALGPVVHRMLGLDVDPAPLPRVGALSRGLAPTVTALRGMRPPRFPTLFETFASVVPFQQVSLESGVAIVTRLVERFGRVLTHQESRHHAFPAAADLADVRADALRAAGLSAAKADALRQLARAIAGGELTLEELESLDTAAALERLRELPRIGPWSAALVLLRGLGRLDVFPPGDVGANRSLAGLLGARGRGDPATRLQRLVARAGPARGYLYFCALGSVLLERGLIHAAPEAGEVAGAATAGRRRSRRR
jgi:3-methyladenine DNA glycosylase/8-oxoguanine DNA glycosylase